MSWLRTNNPGTPKVSLCSAALLVVTTVSAVQLCPAQALQKGISVELAATNSAASEPDADKQDALIITVTDSGRLYFGTAPVSASDLADKLKSHPRRRGQRLYIKADARASFGDVKAALAAARTNSFDAPVLLTSRSWSRVSGKILPPRGLEVLVRAPSSGQTIVVQLFRSEQPSSMVKVNGELVSWADLQGRLTLPVRNGDQRIVQIEANDPVPFADIVRVVDQSYAAGFTVALPSFHAI